MKNYTEIEAAIMNAQTTGNITHILYVDGKGKVTERPVLVSEAYPDKGFFRAETNEGTRNFRFDRVDSYS
jgi:hypothetical protein